MPFILKSKFKFPPPVLAAVAINVTAVPAQIGPLSGVLILTDGVRFAFTVIVMAFENAELEERQLPPATLIEHETISPFAIALDI